jgi:linoleoyl-CoA desaturase
VLSGPSAPFAFAGAGIANLTRNVWAFSIIFCGHFPDGVSQYTEEEIEGESRGEWYVRQLLGSANIDGPPLLHLMTGNLSHQIEHHLFPDLPSNRYAEIAPRVRDLCERLGLPYNSGSLVGQTVGTWKRVVRMALPPNPFAPRRSRGPAVSSASRAA